MKALRIIGFVASLGVGVFTTLLVWGAIYSSHWTLNGRDISDRLGDKQFITDNALNLRETHILNLNELLSTFTGNYHSLFPVFSWETGLGGFALSYLLLHILLCALVTWGLYIGTQRLFRRLVPSASGKAAL
ncbi:MAG: hypothetical protein LUQ11_12975 [Methylococcaceae bacterium]|nr:hypothetical protein [Methylococcaceae bacterium]